MSEPVLSAFDPLRAPAGDGEFLIEPPLSQWPRLIEHNRELRAREPLRIGGQTTTESARASAGPRILLGHQPEFFHPGVWAKNVVASGFARSVGGEAIFMIVDNDAPDHTTLRWPQGTGANLHVAELAMPWAGAGVTFEQQPPRSTREWGAIWAPVLAEFRSDTSHGLSAFVDGFLQPPASPEPQTSDYVRRWMSGIQALDRGAGVLSPRFECVSGLSSTIRRSNVSWGRFVAHLIHQAGEFASAYNAALADYRASRMIRGTHHPIPDLVIDGERIELPLWAWRGAEPRRRVYVTREASGPSVWASDQHISRLSKDDDFSAEGRLAEWNIRPRALTLTLYARLFAGDFFVHGLGGAKYDVITDGLIRRFFGTQPPAYACVTATLRLCMPIERIADTEVAQTRRMIRDAKYNPQRLVAGTSESARLIAARTAAVDESERLRGYQPQQHAARRRIFEHIHALNESLRRLKPDLDMTAHAAFADVQRKTAAAAIAQSREWFYGLYPRTALRGLAERLSG